MPRHISACGPGVLRSGDLAAHHATGFEHLSQKKYFASPGGESSSTTTNMLTVKEHAGIIDQKFVV